jgi:hypothetical protein
MSNDVDLGIASVPAIRLTSELCEEAGGLSGAYQFYMLAAMPLRFLGATPLRGVGLSAAIPQPPCGRLAGFPLQSLARLPRKTIAHALPKARDKAAISRVCLTLLSP